MSKASTALVSRIAVPALVVAAAALVAPHGVAQAASLNCPAAQADLPSDAVDRAMEVATAQARESFPDRNTADSHAVGATRSDSGPMAQRIIKDCGVEVQRRTVVVDLVLPAMLPDSARTFGSVAVSHIDGRYQVWQAA